MAIKAKAEKNGIRIDDAYIVIVGIKMEKYLRPTLDPETNEFAGNVVTDQYSARVSIYSSEDQRINEFGASEFNYTIFFDHKDGGDPIKEAYKALKRIGLVGWNISNMVDA